ncbi:hypothetical protein [Luteimonas sp. e5]
MAALVLPLLALANVALYIAYAGNPLLSSDAWYFVDTFLQKAYSEGVGVVDFYVKRSSDDHAQPIQKLLLLANARWFNLDFVIESYVGLVLALLTFLAAFSQMRKGAIEGGHSHLHFIVTTAAVAGVLFSLNSGMVFSWSLVTLGFMLPLLLLLAATAAWHLLVDGRLMPLALVMLLIAFTQDSGASLLAAALIGATVLYRLTGQASGWRRPMLTILLVITSILLYTALSSWYLHGAMGSALSADGGSGQGNIGPSQLLQFTKIVLATSVVHINQLLHYFPSKADIVQAALALLVALAHGWFWWRAAMDRWNITTFSSVALMLFSYAAAAGIFLVRVPQFGANYANEPRYPLLFSLSIVAILMMTVAAGRHSSWRRTFPTVVAGSIVLLQIPLSLFTWKEGAYLQAYYHQMAAQMIMLGDAPESTPEQCLPMLVICNASQEERKMLINFLKTYQLNAYSTSVMDRYQLSPRHPELDD